MKRHLALVTALLSTGLALPALAQVYDQGTTTSPASAGNAQDGLNDPDTFGDPEDDGLDTTTNDADGDGTADTVEDTDASVSSVSSSSSSSSLSFSSSSSVTSVGGWTGTGGSMTDDTNKGTIPSALPATGGGGMAN